MMRSIGGRNTSEQTISIRRSSLSFLQFSVLLFLVFCSTDSWAWYQYPPLQKGFRPTSYQNEGFRSAAIKRSTRGQINGLKALPLSPLKSHMQTSSRTRGNRNALFSRHARNDNDNCYRKMLPGLRSTRFGRKFLRIISLKSLLMIAATMILSPGSAAASTTTVPASAVPIITCPVSAATEYRLMIRLVVAALIGAALGKERSFTKHSAGVRTMSLVSMGAAVFTVCSGYGFANFPKVDASRMAANVASGVGFVGAGVITTSMRNQENGNPYNPQSNVVHGLTTAATIWLSAAVGVACGVGLLRVATTAAFSTIFILRMGRKKKKKFPMIDYQQQQQRRISSLSNNRGRSPTRGNTKGDIDDDGDDIAEVHEITDWDAHHDHEPDIVYKDTSPFRSEFPEARPQLISEASQKHQEQETQIKQENKDQLVEKNTSTDANYQIKDPSDLMEEIVRAAWKNDNKTVTTLVDMVLSRVEQCDSVSNRKSNTRDDHSSSSDTNYLP